MTPPSPKRPPTTARPSNSGPMPKVGPTAPGSGSDNAPRQTKPKRRPLATSEAGVITVALDGGGTLRLDSQGRVLCKARRRDGESCMAPVVAGLRVCRMHGAGAPDARLKSQRALADLVDPSIRRLGEIIENDDPLNGSKDADVLRAVSIVLDRTGFGPSQTVEVGETRRQLRELLLDAASEDGDADDADSDSGGSWADAVRAALPGRVVDTEEGNDD